MGKLIEKNNFYRKHITTWNEEKLLERMFQILFLVWIIYTAVDLSYNIYMKVSPRVYRPYIDVGSMGEKDPYTNHCSIFYDGNTPKEDYYSCPSNDNYSHFMELQDHSILKISSFGVSISRQTSDGECHIVYNYLENYPSEWDIYNPPHIYKKDNKLVAVLCDTKQYMWDTFQKAPIENSVPLIAAAPTYVLLTDLDTLKTERVFTSEKGTRILYADTRQAVVLSKDSLQLIDMKSKLPIQTFDSGFFVSDEHYTTEVVGNTLNIYHEYQGLIATMTVGDECELKMIQ